MHSHTCSKRVRTPCTSSTSSAPLSLCMHPNISDCRPAGWFAHTSEKPPPNTPPRPYLQLLKAVKVHGMKRSAAARKFNIPASTLFDHVSRKYGRIVSRQPTILVPAEEREIAISLQVLQEIGFELTKDLFGVVIHDYLKDKPTHPNPFKNGIPGQDWWWPFLKRWQSQLSMCTPQHLPTSQASAATP